MSRCRDSAVTHSISRFDGLHSIIVFLIYFRAMYAVQRGEADERGRDEHRSGPCYIDHALRKRMAGVRFAPATAGELVAGADSGRGQDAAEGQQERGLSRSQPGDLEYRAPGLTADGNRGAVPFDDGLDDRESKSASA